jgi:hypothetical protein
MKFSTAFVSFVFCVAATVEGHAHYGQQHHRRGPSATPTQPSTTPTSTPAPPVTPGSGKKRGVPFNDVQAANAFGGNVVVAYNWASTHEGTLNPGVEYAPMLWGTNIGNWADDATAAIANGAKHLLAFNEPDLNAQANISPQVAASLWKQHIEPFAGKAKLVSPAVTNGGPPMGTAWLDSFLAECADCTIDAIAIHIYDSATNAGYFQNYISDVVKKYKKPVWVTEFGASGTAQQQQDFLRTMIPFLENLDGLEHYFYFMAGQNILNDGSNKLTALGQVYNTL